MSERAQIKVGVIATVIGGIILAIILASTEYLGPGLARLARDIWRWLGSGVALPGWLVVVVGLAILGLFGAGWRALSKKPAWNIPVSPKVELDIARLRPLLDKHELSVLRALAHADGADLKIDRLTGQTGTKRLLIEQALDRLRDRGYLEDHYNALSGRSYSLTPAGRDAVIGRDVV